MPAGVRVTDSPQITYTAPAETRARIHMAKPTVPFQINGNHADAFSAEGTEADLLSVVDGAKTAMQDALVDFADNPEWQAAWGRFIASSKEWRERRKVRS